MNPQMLAAFLGAILLFHSTAMASVYLPNSFFKLRPLHPSARKASHATARRSGYSLSINMHYMLTGTIVAVFIAFTVAQDHEAQKRGMREFYFLQQVGKNGEPAAWRDQLHQLRAEMSEVAPLSATLPPVDNTPSLPIPTSDLEQMIEKDDPILARAEFKRTNARAANTIRRIVARLVALGIGRWGQR
uniref:Uncharacterized protein n=1 Tax=Plectus sambesii TaxID=2011161 RepID=A0A914VNK1_9BILA